MTDTAPQTGAAANMVALPVFADDYGRMLIACAELVTDDQAVLDRLEQITGQRKEVVCEFGGAGAKGFAELFTGGKRGHLHVEVYGPKWPTRRRPKPNKTSDEFSLMLGEFIGHKVSVHLTARFATPREALPKEGIIRSALDQTRAQVDDVFVRQTGAKYSVEGSPIERLEWFHVKGIDEVRSELAMIVATAITPNYLQDLYERAHGVFKAWVCGDASNGG